MRGLAGLLWGRGSLPGLPQPLRWLTGLLHAMRHAPCTMHHPSHSAGWLAIRQKHIVPILCSIDVLATAFLCRLAGHPGEAQRAAAEAGAGGRRLPAVGRPRVRPRVGMCCAGAAAGTACAWHGCWLGFGERVGFTLAPWSGPRASEYAPPH